jgi:hypothetical protein
MSRWSSLSWLLGLLVGLGVAAAPAAADPPGRVGRIAEATGPVWIFDGQQAEWVTAPINRPVTSGDRLHTDPAARADIRIGSTSLRLDGKTEIEFQRLDDERIRIQLIDGSIGLRIRAADKVREIEIVTPEGRWLPQRVGRYRVDRENGATAVTVADGQGLFEGQGAAQTLYARQRGEFWIDTRLSGPMQYSITEPLRDAFSSWNNSRDEAEDRLAGSRWVSPEMTGADDLDRHGDWQQSPEYGALWVPRAVPPGWAPYRHGRWAWIAPWGWTWIDEAPWGFAPFHYGRWVWYGGAWGWAPGRWVARPVYAPALVAWVGGPRVSVGVTIGGGPAVGWFPLAPREVYVPWYSVSPRYVQSVNVTHVTTITNITQIIHSPNTVVAQTSYQHRYFEPGVTVVPGQVVTGRQPVAPIAAQWRELPGVRDLVRNPGAGPVVVADPGLPVAQPRPGVVAPVRPPAPGMERMNIPERVPSPVARPGGVAPPAVGALPPRVPVAPPMARSDGEMVAPERMGVRPPGVVVPMQPAPAMPGAAPQRRAEPASPLPNTANEQRAADRIGREMGPSIGRPPSWASGPERGERGAQPVERPDRMVIPPAAPPRPVAIPEPRPMPQVPDPRVMAPRPPPMVIPPQPQPRFEPAPRMQAPSRPGRPDEREPSGVSRNDRREQAR